MKKYAMLIVDVQNGVYTGVVSADEALSAL
jgi:hypothetical protein